MSVAASLRMRCGARRPLAHQSDVHRALPARPAPPIYGQSYEALPLVILLAATMAAGSCYAVDMGLRPDQFGDAVTNASKRQGTNIDWGTPVCGEPKYLKGVCVWSMTERFDLTATAFTKRPDRAIWAVSRWHHKNNKLAAEARAFEKMCAALFGAAKPQWTTQKVASFTKRVVGNMNKDTEVREEGLLFMFNTWPDLFSCEVEDED